MRKNIVIIGIIILLVGTVFTVIRNLRPNVSNEALLDRLRENNPGLSDEELLELFESRPGFRLFGNINWILLVIGGIVTAVGFYLRPHKTSSSGFRMGY